MKIAILTAGIWPIDIGGIQKHSFCLAKYLSQNEVFVDVYTFMKNEDIDITKFFTNDELKYISFINVPFPKFPKFPGHYILASWVFSKRITIKVLKNNQYDIIYAQGFTSLYFFLLGKNKNIVTNLHGLNMFQYSPNLRTRVESMALMIPAKCIIKNSKYQISLGGKLTNILTKLSNNNNSIFEISNGIERNWICNNQRSTINNTRKFVVIGRYDKIKGINEINKVLNKINKDFEFHFIGPIPDQDKIVNKNIKYHGLITDSNKIKLILNSSDFLVCPSYSEGMPTAVIEAMACRCAIIATDVGAVSVLVDYSNGWLIAPKNINELFNVFNYAISISNEDLEIMKHNSFEKVKEKFTWDKIAKEHILYFEKIISKNKI